MVKRKKKNIKKERKEIFKWLFGYVVYLLLVWLGFRYFVRLPEVIEELWFKPVVWLIPWFWWRMGKKGRPALFEGKWGKTILSGIVMGGGYFWLIRGLRGELILNSGDWTLDILGTSLSTAVVEEMVFSGLILGLLDEIWGKRWKHLLIVILLTMVVHWPIKIFVYRLGMAELVASSLLVGSVAGINGWLRRVTGNTVSAILARWGMILAVLM